MPRKNTTKSQIVREQLRQLKEFFEETREQGSKIRKLLSGEEYSRKVDALESALIELSNQAQIYIDHPRLVELFYFEAMFKLLKERMSTGKDWPRCVSDIEVLLGKPDSKTVNKILYTYNRNLELEDAAKRKAARKKASRKAVSRG